MRESTLEQVDQEKDLGIIINADLECSQQCLYAYNKANKFLEIIRRTIKDKEPRIMLSLFKTFVRPHILEGLSTQRKSYWKMFSIDSRK